MKRSLLLILLSLYLLGTGCKKEGQLVSGIISYKDGANWVAKSTYTGYKPLATKDTLFIIAHNNEEHLTIVLKQTGTGVYQPVELTNFYITLGYDMFVSAYRLDDSANNLVTITSYDESSRQLVGTFNLTFKNTRTNTGYPDKVVFTNGKINTELKNVYMNPYIPK